MKKTIRLALKPLNIDIVNREKLAKLELIERVFADFESIIRHPYGYFQRGGEEEGTLWATHDAGFFSCLTTIMWTVMDITRTGERCYTIDNSLGMNSFKENKFRNTFYDLFLKKYKSEVDELVTIKPYRMSHFYQHSSYHEIIQEHLGYEWAKVFLNAYMSPSEEVSKITEYFVEKYQICSTPTISVCYRGTDKHTEITPSPLSDYFHAVDGLLRKYSDAEVLIQTDQAQVRDLFVQKFGSSCKYIEELPVTRGSRVMHSDSRLCGNRDLFAKNLYAMCLAVSKSRALVTHTGNVGFFLALQSLIAGNEVIQLS